MKYQFGFRCVVDKVILLSRLEYSGNSTLLDECILDNNEDI